MGTTRWRQRMMSKAVRWFILDSTAIWVCNHPHVSVTFRSHRNGSGITEAIVWRYQVSETRSVMSWTAVPQLRSYLNFGLSEIFTLMSNHQLYHEVLASAAQGTALWEPSTSSSQIAPSIGDVGYLRFGAFIRLFNTTLPPGHKDNENGEPANYVPLNMHSISVRRHILPSGVIAAAGVEIGPSQNET